MESDTSVLVDGLVFPECPRWHEKELWFSDMLAHRVVKIGLNGISHVVAEFNDKPGGLGFLPNGSLLVVQMRRRQILRVDSQGITLHSDLNCFPGQYLNDMVSDSRGYSYIGSRNNGKYVFDNQGGVTRVLLGPVATHDTAKGRSTINPSRCESIVLVLPDGSAKIVAEDLAGPNGLVVTADGKTLVVSETWAKRLSAFTINADGSLSDRRIFANLDDNPDGICLDAEGAIWAALVFRKKFVRVREGGEALQTISLDNNKSALACVLGGPDRRTLLMATANHDFKSTSSANTKGFIETARVDVPGAGLP